MSASGETHYQAPGWFTRHVFNPMISGLTKMGISVLGSRELRVRGRKSGEWRAVPVNLLTFDGRRYLVAPARSHAMGSKPARRGER